MLNWKTTDTQGGALPTVATVQYKVVEHEYLNRSVPEEGPGSTHDVVSDVSKYVIWREELGSDMPADQVLAYLSDLLSDQMEEDNAFDCTEYNYFVYRNDGGKWKWVGKLTRIPEPDDPVEFEEYMATHCPHCGGTPEVHKERACEKCGDCLCGGYCDFVYEEEPEPDLMASCYFCGLVSCPGGCFEEKKACRTWLSESPSRHFWRAYYWLNSVLNRRAA